MALNESVKGQASNRQTKQLIQSQCETMLQRHEKNEGHHGRGIIPQKRSFTAAGQG